MPEWFTAYDFSTDYTKMFQFTPNTNKGVTGAPKLSLFTVPTETPGLSRQVVKIDYSGTGYNFLAGLGANNQIHLNTLPDGTNGTYQGMIYVVSPTTKLTNTAYNPDKTSDFAPSGITFNPDWVQGNTSNLYYVGKSDFTINQVGGANTASVAKGNQNDILVDSGISNLYGSSEMEYAVRLINGSGSNLTNVAALVNLPQASDTSFTFQLSGRPVYDGDKSGYTFLYSTELGDLKKNSDPDGTKPDETGYVTADQVTDWSKIKSIIIKVASLNNNGRSDRLIFTGTDPNLVNDAGKTGYLSTGFYSDTTKPFISSEAVYNSSTAANKVKPGNITITGEAKINFKLQYTDSDGVEHIVDLPDLSTSYNLAQNNTMLTEQQAIDLANKNAASSIPENYEIKSATLQSGGKTWQTDAPEGTPVFGGKVQYFYNGATVILQAVPIQRKITYQVIDENDPANPTTIQAETDLLNNGQAITGTQGSSVPTDATTAYDAIKTGLEKQGYVISSNSSTLPTTFPNSNIALTIYVTHGKTNVSTPDQWPTSVESGDRVDLSKTISRTITVEGLPTQVAGTTQEVTFTRTAVVDNVTHKVIGYVDPSDTTKTITNGDDAWTSNNKWDEFIPSNVPAGYSIKSITDANGNYGDVTSADGKLTGVAQTTVLANASDVKVTITYQGDKVSNTITFVDADDNNKQVGSTITINGLVGETDSNLNLAVPEGYELANGVSLPTSYTFEATNTPIVIPLVHKHKTVGPNDTWPSSSTDADKVSLSKTITRTINVNGLPTQVPSVEQSVTFNRTAIVDEVTGKVIGWVNPEGGNDLDATAGDSAWKSENSSWPAWSNSNVPEGYYISSAKLNDGNDYSEVVKDQNGIITGLKGVSVTSANSSIVVNVEYSKVDLDLTIKHDKITNTYNGKEQPVAADVISAITHTVESSNTNIPVENIANAIKDAQLTSEDYSYTDNQGNVLSGAPTNIGDYRIILNQNGLDKLKGVSGGLTINYDPTKSYVEYEIVPAKINVSGDGTQTSNYNGSTPTLDLSNFPLTLTPQDEAPTPDISNILTSGDYVITDDNGKPITPTDHGTYKVTLTEGGLKKLQAKLPNYTWPTGPINIGNLIINSVSTTAAVSGSNSRIYNGQSVSNADLYTDGSTISVKIKGLDPNTEITYVLKQGDYDWDSANPTNAGKYTLTLNSTGVANLQAELDKQYGSGNVTIAAGQVTGNASFTINKATATVAFAGKGQDPVEYTGQTGKFKASDYQPKISTNNGLTLSIPEGVNLSVADCDYEFTDKDGHTITTEPTALGSYTVKLSQRGFEKLQSQTNNYNWENKAIGTYSITKATNVSVTLSGEQVETYKAAAYNNGNINVDNYSVNLGNGLTYKLVDGDLEFVPNQDPTNVGTYKVQLSDKGKQHISAVQGDNYSYNFDNVGTVDFKIGKATPSATFTGQGEKTYDGTPINGYKPAITITAPGTNNVTLEAGTDYVWTKDGVDYTTAPSDAGNYTVKLTQTGINKVKAVNADNLDWTNVTITGTPTYDISKAQATVNFDKPAKQSVEYGKGSFDTNDFKPGISTNNNVTVNVPDGVTLSVEAGDYIFTKDGQSQTTVPTELGTYTVTLSDQGFKKLQSQTNNYDWVNSATGTYTVNSATDISVTLTNIGDGQKVTYTGNKFTNSDINVADYKVTLGNGQSYKLVAGDLEFVPNQDPTNVGTYKVQLSAQGKENIAKVDSTHYSYNFDNAGTGTFEIQKATPKVEFNASAEKVFDNTPIPLDKYTTKPSLTITAPGNPTLTLEAGDYVWVKDGVTYTTAPSGVGSYTIQLTEAGKNKILQNSDNSDNLNWAKTTISGEGSYVITEARATANLSGKSSKTYDGKPVTTAEINSKDGSVEVTISIPNSTETVTYKLQNGDYTWNTPNGDAPTNAGDYTFKLSPDGLTHLQSEINAKWGEGNVKISTDDLKGEASFTINKDDITISGDNTQTGTYTGNPQVVDPGNFPISLKPNGNGPVPTIPSGTLTSGDFTVKDKDGKPVDPTDVGDYTVYLTPDGIAKLKKLNPNYNWPTTEQEVGKLVINAAQASVTVSGENSRIYNGQVISTDDLYKGGNITVTMTGINGDKITYTLKDGDYTWNVADPTNVGTYTLTLSSTGIENLQKQLTEKYGAGNVTLASDKVTGNAKFTITPASITISGNGGQTETYTGNPQVIDPGNFPISLTSPDAKIPEIPAGTLTSGDFTVKGKDGKPVDPTNVGDYTVYLTPDGIAKLKKLNPNFDWPTTDQKVGTLTITPATMDVTLSGNGSKVSDGQPANVDLPTLLNNLSGANLNKDGLTLDDFSWNTPDGKAPTNVGNYTITLNENGLKKLKDNNPNYTVNVTGEFTYTITAASQKIEYVDSEGNVIKTIDNIGTDSSNYGDKVDFNVRQNVPEDYRLVDSDVSSQITIENGVTKFVVERIDDTPVVPPTPTPTPEPEPNPQPTEPKKDNPGSLTPDKKPDKPSKPSKPNDNQNKDKKPAIPNKPKKTSESVFPKNDDKDKLKKEYNESVPAKEASYSENIGAKHNAVANTNENAHTLPQTGSRKDSFAVIAGVLAVGLGLFGLSTRRKKRR